MDFKINFSNILLTLGRREIGRNLCTEAGLDFGSGHTSAILHICGKMALSRQQLQVLHKGSAIK